MQSLGFIQKTQPTGQLESNEHLGAGFLEEPKCLSVQEQGRFFLR